MTSYGCWVCITNRVSLPWCSGQTHILHSLLQCPPLLPGPSQPTYICIHVKNISYCAFKKVHCIFEKYLFLYTFTLPASWGCSVLIVLRHWWEAWAGEGVEGEEERWARSWQTLRDDHGNVVWETTNHGGIFIIITCRGKGSVQWGWSDETCDEESLYKTWSIDGEESVAENQGKTVSNNPRKSRKILF